AYLKIKDERGRDIIKDTAIVFDEKFTFEGNIINPEMWFLSVNSVVGEIPIILENSNITIDLNKENIRESKISGSKSNNALNEYTTTLKDLSEKRREVNRNMR